MESVFEHMKNLKKHYKKILILLIAIYTISVFASQQKILNAYNSEVNQYKEKIDTAKDTKESLLSIKDNVNSPEYIEKIAREKLGMYLPNEKVYIDVAK